MSDEFNHLLRRRLVDAGVQPLDDPVIFGSAVMKLHGLKDVIGDVDLFVTARAYARLRLLPEWQERRPREEDPPYLSHITGDGGLPLSVFYTWTTRDAWLDVPNAVATAERVGEHLCVRLELVANWKLKALCWCIEHKVTITDSPWEKHVNDLRTLEAAGVAVTRDLVVERR